ncbi:WD repeat domain phosphoinositide-interacting protein 1 isoform X4 [Hippopotamus amphibius kiboko]|uniref:WD repeat domain phosphoinositide-interacting protein 1 isoform X4 n=1 Tax=Hippopotamus amphibius kiboko TaxID=575201 RepID=UPI002595F319|nr:WD repeat domain phosphoinositide-interacting protein 1 isoform X4 [Hippopotamus amphibius kiboko]XP_057570825.1 WD repeat domain phosphoinositide-interacting protein 1 isoform X4 [Hippopotamus amphibius kiboko]
MEAGAADGPPGGVEEALSCFSFNQDCTSLAIGTTSGYKLFSLSSVEQLDHVHGSNDIPDVYIVERLFSSSLVVVVSHTKPRQMNVYHFKKGTEICSYSYSGNILSIRLNRQRLLVCLEESIYIHNIKDMKLLKNILDIPANPTGLSILDVACLCALSINHSNSYVAYPGSRTTGEIVLYDGHSLKTVCTIAAHEGPLAAIAFNASGSRLASASEKGTVIRVFSVPEGQKLYEFRRGMKRYVTISSLAFSMDSQFLCASSNTETVHIFKLEHLANSRPEEPSTWTGYVGKMFVAASNYLPTQVSDMMNQDRAFATGRLGFSGHRNICTLSTIQKLPRLLVASSSGHLYIYNVDPQDGGDCVLIKTHRLLGGRRGAPRRGHPRARVCDGTRVS